MKIICKEIVGMQEKEFTVEIDEEKSLVSIDTFNGFINVFPMSSMDIEE